MKRKKNGRPRSPVFSPIYPSTRLLRQSIMKSWPVKFILIIGGLILVFLWYIASDNGNQKIISTIQKRTGTEANFTIVAFGDSLTAGYGLREDESYPAQLQKALTLAGYEVKVINLGVSGETTAENLKRINEVKSLNPDIVLLGIGGNDALRQLPVAETKKNILSEITLIQDDINPPVVVLLQMQAPPTAGLSYKDDFDNLYKEVAEERNVILVPFITMKLFLDPKNKLADGIHYNALGYKKVIDQYLQPTMIEILDKLEGD